MPMPSPFPKHLFTKAFDALVAVLKEDELLGETVKTWRTWDGEPGDVAEPDPNMMPWLRLTPTLSPIKFASVNSYQEDFGVLVEMACNTTDVRHMLNFWGAVLQALVDDKPHRDMTVRNFLWDDGKVVTYKVSQAGGAPVLHKGYLTSRAVVTLMVHVDA